MLLMMDSITRFAMAQREVGLAAGEPPTAKGYPPSVFARLPGLLERAGDVRDAGSITAFYTVLVEGDDHNEPIADAVRAHPRRPHRARRATWRRATTIPAIDILPSVSRTMPSVTSLGAPAQGRGRCASGWPRSATTRISSASARTCPAAIPRIDTALARREAIGRFLCQSADTSGRLADAIDALAAL